MAIEITEFADVSISVSPVGVLSGNFGILGFLAVATDLAVVGKEITHAERYRAYQGLASVGDDWQATSEVYKAATAFYGQTPQPKDFTVLMAYEAAQAAILVGGGSDTVVELQAITAGTLDITIDGVLEEAVALDFSGDADYDAVAATVEAALLVAGSSATCTHNGLQFLVTSATTGITSLISFATGTAADALGLMQHQGAIADGIAAETPVDALAANLTAGVSWVGTVTDKKFRDVLSGAAGTTTLEVASWCEGAKKIFCNTTNDLTVLSSVITSDIASVLKSATLRYSLTTFSKNQSLYPSASVFGRAASVNFESIGSTITLNLKQMPGVTAEDLTPGEFAILKSKYASAVVKIGKTVNAYTDSRMASGSWLDTTHGLLWLEDRCETDLFNLLYVNSTKIPYTQEGINIVIGRLEKSLEAAIRNGLAAPGYLPDGTFLPKGYIIESVALGDVASGDKGNRIYRGLSFKIVGAGALHEVVVSGEFTE